MYRFLKFFLFLLGPESAHHLTFACLRAPAARFFLKLFIKKDNQLLTKKVFGLDFNNPVGLGAGLDKDAVAFKGLGALGFGFIEIGTVTPRPQPGNEKPRLFRLPKDEALINRMGFNNLGAVEAAKKLKLRKDKSLVIGGNIGKNKDTPLEKAGDDYIFCFNALFEVVDYFVVNVSSPNTPGLRNLQEKEPLKLLLKSLQLLNNQKLTPKPLLLKIAPDLTDSQLDDIIEIVKETGLAGIVATNTTISRDGLSYSSSEIKAFGAGGLSGKPLCKRSTEVIRYLREKSGNGFPIIGVGGIHSAHDAIEKLDAGADLVQLYTGFIYEGPGLISKIKKALLARIK